MEEEWRYIDGTNEKYQISNFGRIRSLYKVRNNKRFYNIRYLKWTLSTKGYYQTRLCVNGQFIAEFACMADAAEACGLKDTSRIKDACLNWNKTSGGYKWKLKKN